MQELTQEHLKELLTYDPDTGIFVWKTRGIKDFDAQWAGKIAGSINKSGGYIEIKIENKSYLAHRLVFLYMTGKQPKIEADHINHNKTNNIWLNLREVTTQENHRNMGLIATNTSGFNGVTWHKPLGKWAARIKIDGILKHLGYFENKPDAISSRKAADRKYNFHKNHGLLV